jgi:hypothetical protein
MAKNVYKVIPVFFREKYFILRLVFPVDETVGSPCKKPLCFDGGVFFLDRCLLMGDPTKRTPQKKEPGFAYSTRRWKES